MPTGLKLLANACERLRDSPQTASACPCLDGAVAPCLLPDYQLCRSKFRVAGGVCTSRLSPACLRAVARRRWQRWTPANHRNGPEHVTLLQGHGDTEAAFLLCSSRSAALLSLLCFETDLCGFIKLPAGVEVTQTGSGSLRSGAVVGDGDYSSHPSLDRSGIPSVPSIRSVMVSLLSAQSHCN